MFERQSVAERGKQRQLPCRGSLPRRPQCQTSPTGAKSGSPRGDLGPSLGLPPLLPPRAHVSRMLGPSRVGCRRPDRPQGQTAAPKLAFQLCSPWPWKLPSCGGGACLKAGSELAAKRLRGGSRLAGKVRELLGAGGKPQRHPVGSLGCA